MAKMGTGTDDQQGVPTPSESGAEEAFKAKVHRAFALGWRIAELHYLPRDVRDSAKSSHPLAPVPDFDLPTRARLLIAQICADLDWLGLEPSGGVRPLGATGPPSNPSVDAMPVLDSIEVPASVDMDEEKVKGAAAKLHRPILLRLSVRNAELGRAYSVGVGLACTVFEAYQETQLVLAAAPVTDPGITLRRVKQAVAKGFTEQRVRELWTEIKDLESRFSPYAATPIAAVMSDWANWAASHPIRRGQPSASDQLLTVSARLRRQGQVWRALLSGERNPKDMLRTANYVEGAIDLVRKYSSIFVRMLGANAPTAAILVGAVLSVALIVLQRFTNSVVTWVVVLLAALGTSGAGVVAALQSVAAKAEDALWEAELVGAIGVAINYVPAVPAYSEVEILRGVNLRSQGPLIVLPPIEDDN